MAVDDDASPFFAAVGLRAFEAGLGAALETGLAETT